MNVSVCVLDVRRICGCACAHVRMRGSERAVFKGTKYSAKCEFVSINGSVL